MIASQFIAAVREGVQYFPHLHLSPSLRIEPTRDVLEYLHGAGEVQRHNDDVSSWALSWALDGALASELCSGGFGTATFGHSLRQIMGIRLEGNTPMAGLNQWGGESTAIVPSFRSSTHIGSVPGWETWAGGSVLGDLSRNGGVWSGGVTPPESIERWKFRDTHWLQHLWQCSVAKALGAALSKAPPQSLGSSSIATLSRHLDSSYSCNEQELSAAKRSRASGNAGWYALAMLFELLSR